MNPKLEKQKQIFSLLNHKFGALLDDSGVQISEQSVGEKEFSTLAETKLINKVYNFYRSIIQNINEGLITADLDGEITFANKAAARILGFNNNDLPGKPISDVFSEDRESQRCLRSVFLPGKNISDKEVSLIRKDSQKILAGLSSSPLHDEDNKFDGVVVLFRDLTEVYHLRKQLERMERLALLGELSAGIAHEIRNPLAGIKTSAQVLEESFGKDDFRYQMVERIVREVNKANRLLKEFFKFAKPTKPKLNFCDVEMIIDGVYLLLAPKMQKRKIHFLTDFDRKVPQVYVDETQLEQVFINLFLNSIDALPGGGEIKIKTYDKQIRLLDKQKEKLSVQDNELNYVLVEVSDNGEGIPSENVNKIFNPFFTTKTEGVGLGLSICNRMVEENGGKIDVSSVMNQGTTFTLALPAFVHNR